MSQEASARIDKHIAGFTDWRGKRMAGLRKIINAADPSLKEEWKWDIPIWSSNGNVCAIGAFKDHSFQRPHQNQLLQGRQPVGSAPSLQRVTRGQGIAFDRPVSKRYR